MFNEELHGAEQTAVLDQCAVAADLGRSVYRDTLYTHSLSLRLSHMHPIRFPSLTCSELDFMSETHHSVSESQVEYS